MLNRRELKIRLFVRTLLVHLTSLSFIICKSSDLARQMQVESRVHVQGLMRTPNDFLDEDLLSNI